MSTLDVGLVLTVLAALFLPLVLAPRIAALLAHLGIWTTAKLAGREELYGEGRAAEGLLARHGRTRTALEPRGKVFVSGELWDAVCDGRIGAGERVEVVGREGLRLRVRPAERGHDD